MIQPKLKYLNWQIQNHIQCGQGIISCFNVLSYGKYRVHWSIQQHHLHYFLSSVSLTYIEKRRGWRDWSLRFSFFDCYKQKFCTADYRRQVKRGSKLCQRSLKSHWRETCLWPHLPKCTIPLKTKSAWLHSGSGASPVLWWKDGPWFNECHGSVNLPVVIPFLCWSAY